VTIELAAPAKAAVRSAAIIAAIAAAFSLPHAAHAQATGNSSPAAAGTSPADTIAPSAGSTPSASGTLPAVRVSVEKEPLPADLEPTFGGGQVAREAVLQRARDFTNSTICGLAWTKHPEVSFFGISRISRVLKPTRSHVRLRTGCPNERRYLSSD
jgi:hypothetical protein